MAGKHSHANGVQRAIFRRMWQLLVALIVSDGLRAFFSRKELMEQGGKEFVDPGRVDLFLDWAVRQEKLSKLNEHNTYRANISPVEYLPSKVQPYLQDKGLLDVAMKLLARIADRTTGILGVGDVELAFSTIHGDVELTNKQALITLAHLVDVGALQEVGANQYIVTGLASPPSHVEPVITGGATDGAETSSGDDEAAHADQSVIAETKSVIIAASAGDVAVLGEAPKISAENLQRARQLFIETCKGPFPTDAKRRADELDFASPAAFSNTMVYLRKAGWIRRGEKRGLWEWNLEKVPTEWFDAARQQESQAEAVIAEAVQVHTDPIAVVAAVEPASVPAAELEDQPVVVETRPELVVEATPAEESEEVVPPPQPDLVEQLVQTHQRLVEQEGISDELTETVIEMMYGYLCYMPRSLQERILGGLATKIKEAEKPKRRRGKRP